MITETAYGEYLGISYEGWPKTNRQMAADYNVDAFFTRWYQWPEIVAVHPFILANWSWNHFAWVHASSGSQDIEAPFGVREPTYPFPQYSAVKAERQRIEGLGLLAPARLTPYRGAVGAIAGMITRADTATPVPYATIYTNGYEFGHVSLFDGKYEVHDVPVGTYTLSVQKVGYAGASQQITVMQNQTTTANFNLTYTGKVQHRLYWIDTFAGNSGCHSCSLSHPYHTQSFTTGSDTGFIKFASCKPNVDGVTMRFSIHSGGPGGPQMGVPAYGTLEPGVGGIMIGAEWPDGQEPAVEPNTRYWLRFQRTDGQSVYCYAAGDNPYSGGESGANSGWDYYGYIKGMTRQVNLATGDISGSVTDLGGSPIDGAAVVASSGGSGSTTNSAGQYTITDVPIGTTGVTASKPGYSTESAIGVNVLENQTTTVNFTLEPGPTTGTISGTITDATLGGTLPGALVETTTGSHMTTTDGSGQYLLDEVVPGTYTLRASRTGYQTNQQTNVNVVAGHVTTANLALAMEAPFGGLLNGDFEGSAFDDPNGDHRTANDWHQFTTSGFSKSAVTWLGSGAHSPDRVQDFWEAGYVSGVYQHVANADVGNRYEGRAWCKATDTSVRFRAGIDPAGGSNPDAPGIAWSEESIPGANWAQIAVEAVATSSTITLFIKAHNTSAASRNAFIDDASLIDLGPTIEPTFTTWGDDDQDDDVDQSDFGAFQACLTGPQYSIPPGAATPRGHHCSMFDSDGDNNIDEVDFDYFVDCMSGPNQPTACVVEQPPTGPEAGEASTVADPAAAAR